MPVGHADDQDIVELVHSVYLGQELVDHSVVHAAAVAGLRAPRLADGVDLVEDDDVEAGVGAQPPLFLLGLFEQPPDVGLTLSNIPRLLLLKGGSSTYDVVYCIVYIT